MMGRQLSFRVEKSLKDLVERAADAADRKLPDWLRRSLERLAREEIDGEHPAVEALWRVKMHWMDFDDDEDCECPDPRGDWEGHAKDCGVYLGGYVEKVLEDYGAKR